jgi:acetolactate synthase I/III small subunit
LFDGRVVDLNCSLITVELSAKKSRIDAFLALLKPYGIQEAIRSGIIALPRVAVEDQSSSGQQQHNQDVPSVDASMLPPG